MKARWTWTDLKARWTAIQLRGCMRLLQGWYLRWIKDSVTSEAAAHWHFTKYLPELNTTRWTNYVDPGYWAPENYAWPGIRARDSLTLAPTAGLNETPTPSIAITVIGRYALAAGAPCNYVVVGYWTPEDYTLRGIRDAVTATLNP